MLCHLKGEGPFSFFVGPFSALTPDVSVTGERTAVAGLDWCGLGKNTPLFWPHEFIGRGDRADLGSVRLQPGLSYLKQFKFCSTGFTFLFDLFVLLLDGITRLLTLYTEPRTLFLSFHQRKDEESGVPSRQL